MNAREYINFDETLPTGEQLTDDAIIAIDAKDEEFGSEEEDMEEEDMQPTKLKDAIAGAKAFLSYLEQNQVVSAEEYLAVMNVADRLVDEEIKRKKQAKITDFFNK